MHPILHTVVLNLPRYKHVTGLTLDQNFVSQLGARAATGIPLLVYDIYYYIGMCICF